MHWTARAAGWVLASATALLAGGCGGGEPVTRGFRIGEQQAGPYSVLFTSPIEPLAGVPVTFEATTFEGNTKRTDLNYTLTILRTDAGPRAPLLNQAMSVCEGCGAQRVDTTIVDPGSYKLSFSVPQPDGAEPVPLAFQITLR